MWMLAYSIKTGRDQLEDHWSTHETELEAIEALNAVWGASLYCWAVARIHRGSEPQYVRG